MIPETPSDPAVKTAHIRGGSFTYTDEGSGEVVVALHGLPGSVRDWRWLAPALEGMRLVRIDQAGFGGTPLATARGSSLDARTHFVLAALDALAIDRCVIAGHSMGGPLAMSVAASGRASGIALLASVGLRPHRLVRKVGRYPDLPRFFDLPLVGRLLRPPLRASFVRAGFPASTTDAAILQTMRIFSGLSFAAIRAAASGVRCPTLLAWAEDDPLVEEAIGLELARALPPGPRVVFPDGGHNIQKTRAVELGEAISAFAITLRSGASAA